MIKTCVVLNGKIINVGEWDYQIIRKEVSPEERDEFGNITKEAEYEEEIGNPLPEGAVVEERDFEYDLDRGWYEPGTQMPLTETEILKSQLAEANLQIIDLFEQLLNRGVL